MTLTIDEVDRALADWQARLRLIDDNLVALETSPTCMLLEQATDSGLEGATRARVAPALAAMRELFAQRGLLDDVLARATAIRKGVNRLWPGDGVREIEQLLRGPSISLPPIETPLARRGLLDAAETSTAISPDQLLAAMVRSFEEARDAVAMVDDAWTRLTPGADRAEVEAKRLEAQAAVLGTDIKAPLARIRSQLDTVRSQVARDPLGAAGALAAQVSAALEELGRRLSALAGRRQQVVTDLERAHQLLSEIGVAHRDAEVAHARWAAEIQLDPDDAPPPAPADPARIEGVAAWLATLDATLGAGRWEAAGVGVGRWLAAAGPLLHDDQEAARAAAAPVELRDELRGRLGARRQQARTLASRGQALDPGLASAAEEAETLLRRCPTPITRAARAVADYEERLARSRT